ncbi:MAG: hypothetical protein B6230_04905 [Desulfobacteraceae bacterium 4572_89]|nr:MAG: hypothetical protein B6230_04905 [Desulfobacteraceae bacterium 4572_89]
MPEYTPLENMIMIRQQIHTRDICLSTYPHTDSQVLVHGKLKDKRYIPIFDITGKLKNPGTIHNMSVTFLINSNPLTIIKAEAHMVTVPMPECRETLDRVALLEGVKIESGFSSQIQKIMGGNRGCTHLCGLVKAMGQEIVHGWLTQKRSEETPIPASLDEVKEKQFLIDSCRMWKKGGPKMQELAMAMGKGNEKKQ